MDNLTDSIGALSPEQRELLTLLLQEQGSKFNAFPLSFAQQRLWFLDQLEPGSPAYNIAAAVRMQGPLDLDAFKQSFDEIVRRHESLRTTFTSIEGKPVQVIAAELELTIPLNDLSNLSKDEQEAEVLRLAQEESRYQFDLTAGPLINVRVLRLDVAEHVALVTMHHIVSDGWSIGVLIRELAALYETYLQGLPPSLPALPIQYADYARWQNTWLQPETVHDQLAYWKQQLDGELPVLRLPSDRPRPAVQTYEGARHYICIPADQTERLEALSQREGVTLFMALLAVFEVMLFKYTGQTDLCVGSSIAGRNRAEVEGLIGFFLNSLVLRADLSGNPTFRELLARVRETALGAYAHQDVPVEMLLETLHPVRDRSYNPLFQVMFIFQNTPAAPLTLSNLTLTPMEIDTLTAKFDLTLDLTRKPEGIAGWFEYNSDLFDAATIARLEGHFQTLVANITADPEQRISDLSLLSEAERQQLQTWSEREARSARSGKLVHQLFEEQVDRTPEHVAVSSPGESLTYRELNTRANQIASYLRAHGAGPEGVVGICMERSLDMIAAMLGVLKAGAAYVPLDPGYPAERIAFMINDAGISIVLTQQDLAGRLPSDSMPLIVDRETLERESGDNHDVKISDQNLAYVLYTSGSTGKPKAVEVQHESLATYAETAILNFEVESTDRVLQFASISFDTSAEEIYSCLLSGATLVLRSDAMLVSATEFFRQCDEWKITVLDLPTAYWHELVNAVDTINLPASLRLVILGGEKVRPEYVSRWRERTGDRPRLCNTYGPTEATIVATMFDFGESGSFENAPIGRPIDHVRVRVLDRSLRECPAGISGELYIGGAGLARGYRNHPELTAERFVPDPFGESGARLYKTGDVVRWLPDGNLDYVERVDKQVKIRGFRVETGEIETTLREHSSVSDVVVVPRTEESDTRLVAYVLTKGDAMEPNVLRDFLRRRLPEHMIPSAFVQLESIPLTAHGKVHVRALPAPDRYRSEQGTAFVAPRNPIETLVAGVWAEVLDLEEVGINDNFFDVGGHSLLATQVISRIREALHVELPLRDIFESSTVAGLAEKVEVALRTEHATLPAIKPVSRDQELPLSFPQERLWLVHRLHPTSVAYHVLRPLRISGDLNVPILERTLTEVLSRHEIYRTTIETRQGRPVQVIHPPQEVELPVTDLRSLPREQREEAVQQLISEEGQRPFDLSRGPLWRVTLLRIDDAEYLMMLTEHHLVHDGWTEGRLVLDFLALYEALVTNQPSPLPELPIQYADFAYWQRSTIQGEFLESLLSYWKNQLADLPPMLELPADFPRPPVMTFRGANIGIAFSPELSAAINALSRSEGVTLYMTLMAAFNVLLHRYTRQDDIVVGAPIANRNHVETEMLTGFFVNTLVMRNDLSGNPEFRELLRRVREVALGAYMHQEMPFERLVEELQPDRALNRQPLFQAMFVLHNAPSPPVTLPGMTVETLRVHNGTSKFDLLLAMREEGDHLTAAIEYNTDIFAETTIQRMLAHFENLFRSIVDHPEQRLSQLSLMNEPERRQLLTEWNATEAEYIKDRTVAELFEEQVARTPEAMAVVLQGESLTYKELNERANQLAHFLRTLGIGPEIFTGICMQRSIEMMVAVLGTLKAGGAYLPLDPTYPKERLSYMMEDTKASVLLTQTHLLEMLPEHSARVICLDSEWDMIARESRENLASVTAIENLVYVTYTSGSTGKPKGIGMVQRPLLNLLEWMIRNTELPEGARTVQFASLSFDVSFQDMFSTWLSGGTLVLLTEEQRRDIGSLGSVLNGNDVHRIFIPAVALQQLAEGLCAAGPQASPLRRVIAGSEQLQITKPIAEFFSQAKACSLHNEYGPSETHVVTALSLPLAVDTWPARPCIGRPISNTQIYLLEESFDPTPIGVPGELYIGGDGLARGYLGRPDLTAEKFMPDPFSTRPGARFYRTGDMARYLADGNIEFLGRKDHQVKIRGFRIELGEVETVLGGHPSVQENIVLTWERAAGDRSLVAYIVSQPGAASNVSDIRKFLLAKLPEYMVPSSFIFLESMPLTANGKVNRRALPVPDQSRPELEQDFVAPRTSLEEVVAGIWRDVLGLEQIGVHDNFFELRGHSLLATQVVARLSEIFEFEIPLKTIFQSPTIAGLAAAMVQFEPTPGSLEELARALIEFTALSDEDAQSLLDNQLQTTHADELSEAHQA
jgi:amino acid adenylation domain-containing protein